MAVVIKSDIQASGFPGPKGSAGPAGPPAQAYDTRAALAARPNPALLDIALLAEAGREGIFIFSSSDLSAKVAIDPAQGLYVAPASDLSGASGAWVRHPGIDTWNNVKWFGAKGDGETDDTAAFDAAEDTVSELGGGVVYVPAGIFMGRFVLGDGTDTTSSTKHNRVRLVGAGSGSSPSVSNVETLGVTVLRYNGPEDETAAALDVRGPLHAPQVENLEIDANRLAGIGLRTIHVDSFTYRNVIVRNWTSRNYVFTTRSDNISGAAHGCGNGSMYDCAAYDPASNDANGLLLTSGVDPETSLVGKPDSANIDIYGGVFFYGGSTGTAGIDLAGCDNNSYSGTQFIPAGGNDGGGHSHKWTQWVGSPAFPLGNQLRLGGFTQPMTGTAGTGGNLAWYDSSDSGYIPDIVGLTAWLTDGRCYIDGVLTPSQGPEGPAGPPGPQLPSVMVSDADYTLQLSDVETYIRLTDDGDVAVHVPTHASVPFPVDSVIEFEKTGAAGVVTFVPDGISIISSLNGWRRISGQQGVVRLRCVGTNFWVLSGDLAPSFNDLVLDGFAPVSGVASAGAILGASDGSVIRVSGTHPGLSIDVADLTWSWNGTNAGSVDLTESEAGASHTTSIGYSVSGGGGGGTTGELDFSQAANSGLLLLAA